MAVIAHQSGRWDRTSSAVAESLAKLVAEVPDVSVITLTEMGQKAVASFAPAGFSTIHTPGPGVGECALLYRPDVWAVVRRHLVLLSPANRLIGSMWARDQHVPAVLLHHKPTGQRIWVLVVHMPAHVEGVWSQRDRDVVRHYMQCLAVLAAFRSSTTYPVMFVGDWNLDARKPWVRALLKARLRLRGIIASKAGTHGPRVIDFAVTNRKIAKAAGTVRVSAAPEASDHKRIRFFLRLSKVVK